MTFMRGDDSIKELVLREALSTIVVNNIHSLGACACLPQLSPFPSPILEVGITIIILILL